MKNRHRRAPGRSGGKSAWRRRTGIMAAAVAALGMLAGISYAAAWAAGKAWDRAAALNVFEVSEVQVSGLRYVRKEDLVSFIGDPSGESVFGVDMDGMVRRLSGHPWIKGVSVRRELPGRVRLTVDERSPAVVAEAPSGRYLVDEEGAVLARLTGDDWGYLPTVVYEKAASPSAPGAGPEESLDMAASLIGSVRADETESLAGAVVYIGADGLPYIKLDGAVVTVGRDGYGGKVRRLAEIIGDVRKRGVSPKTVDLRFPGKVIVDGDRTSGSVLEGNS